MRFSTIVLSNLALAAASPVLSSQMWTNATSSSLPASANLGAAAISTAPVTSHNATSPSASATANGGAGAGAAAITPAAVAPQVTVYKAEVVVTIINDVTVVCDVYNAPVTTIVKGATYVINPAPKTTVTETRGTQTVCIVQPVTQTPLPTLTTTVYVGDAVQTVDYVPAAGPTSTAGAALPSTAAVVPTYHYTASDSVCVCPFASTVTQYVTVPAGAGSPAVSTEVPTVSVDVPLPLATAPAAGGSPAVSTEVSTVSVDVPLPLATAPAAGGSPAVSVAVPVVAATPSPASSGPSNCAAPAIAASPTFFPSLIVPVNSSSPDASIGTQYTAHVTPDQRVVLQYNVATTGSYSLNFALPPTAQLLTSSWTVTGDSVFSIAKLPASVTAEVTWNQIPDVLSFTDFTLQQGGIAVVGSSFQAEAGTAIAFIIESKNGATATWFEDYNCPYVGLSLVAA